MKKLFCRCVRMISISLIAAMLLVGFVACGQEKDEYKLISEAFAQYIDASAYSHEFYVVDKCVDDDGTEYYYFEMKLVNDFSQKYGLEDTGGIIVYNENGFFDFTHLDMLKSGTDSTLLKYNELRSAGKSHEFTKEEIAILDERIAALFSASTGNAEAAR